MAEVIKNLPAEVNLESAIILDAHLLKTYRACQQKFNYFELQHLIRKQKKAAPGFGIALHEAIAAFRLSRKANQPYPLALEMGAKALAEAYAKNMPAEQKSEVMQDDRRSASNAMRLFLGFCEKWESAGYTYHQIEVSFSLYLGQIPSFTNDNFKRDVVYVGIIDAILSDSQLTYVEDLKSTSWNINQDWLDGFKMDQGLIGYLVAARELCGVKTNHALVHGIWVQKEPKTKGGKPLSDYFHAHPLYWDEDQIAEWTVNTLATVKEIEEKKASNIWLMDFGQNCGAFGGCDYRPLCSRTPKGRDQLAALDYERAVWSPLEDERLQKLGD